MTLTPVCGYSEETHLHTCGECGRELNYWHVVSCDNGAGVELGIECVRRLRREGRITRREALNGRYDWTLRDVRERAKAEFDARHLR